MGDVVVHGTRESRFVLERESGEELLTRLIAANASAGMRPLNLLIIVAHPDDEAIGAGSLLRGFPGASVVHVTDGAPADADYARPRKGFESRDAYANARRYEVVAALGHHRHSPGIADSRARVCGRR